MNCPRCEADPHPKGFGNPRDCAFTTDKFGTPPHEILFTTENWNCATLGALLDLHDVDRDATIYGLDESLDLVPAVPPGRAVPPEPCGWIVLTRYKRRGRCSSAIHVGDFFPAQPVTLALVEETIRYMRSKRARR